MDSKPLPLVALLPFSSFSALTGGESWEEVGGERVFLIAFESNCAERT